MKAGKSAENVFVSELTALMSTREWSQIAKQSVVTGVFNLFELIEDAVCENAWSRIIQFLFDSSAAHGLERAPFLHWCSHSLKVVPDWITSAAASASETEWGTFERRRLDILVKLLDADGHLLGVLGIENKVWSGEQFEQLSHYQAALTWAFPHVPKLLIFLTPDRREPITAAGSEECPVQNASYMSLVEMCDVLLPQSQQSLRLLISSLRQYLKKNMVMKQFQDDAMRLRVARLYQNAGHRRIIEQIIAHRPTVKAVLELVAADIEKAFSLGEFGGSCACTHDYWPEKDDFTPELRIWLQGLKLPKGVSICYMLRSKPKGPKPFIGDKFTMLLNAHCESDVAREQIRNSTLKLPMRHAHKWKRWRDWEVLWEGETYELRDLDRKDVAQLTDHLKAAIQKTFKPLCVALS